MSPPPLIVIFGAAVLKEGWPSAALLRRIAYGYEAARIHHDAFVLCSGGVGRHGPSEASIMAEVLAGRGLAAERLILDELSVDTLQNVEAAVRQVREGGHPYVVACSDAYHLPRIRMLLALHGIETRPGPAPRDRAGGSLAHRVAMSLRELLAIPHSLARFLMRRRRLAS